MTGDGPERPWPVVQIGGELERAEREWIHTNGTGAYAMSTLALMHTRRHHAILAAALEPPFGRYLVLSHAETSVQVGDRSYRLSTHQFPNLAPTPGYRLLQSFAQDPLPRWTYRLGKAELERRLCLARGKNTLIVEYVWRGKGPAQLFLRPLMPLRPVNALMTEHGSMVQRVALKPGAVEIQPMLALPPVTFGHTGVFVGSPDWWRRFEYLEERGVESDFQEDLWTPGTFEIRLEPGVPSYLAVSVGGALPDAPAAMMQQTVDHLLAQDPGPGVAPAVRALSIAADAFVAADIDAPVIVTGYPWYDIRPRDTLIALPGLLLCRGRHATAKAVIATLLDHQHAGLLPDALQPKGQVRAKPSPDATLWLFEAARLLARAVGSDDEFLRRRLYPALRRAFVRLRSHRRRQIWLTSEGLLATGTEGAALTWMDAQVGAHVITPRRGLAIELQALWTRACQTLHDFATAYGDDPTARASSQARHVARQAFRARFWCNEIDYPFDCISEVRDTADAWADPSIRPNAVLALAIDPELFEPWQAAAIVARAREDLLTPRGLRSLAPADRNYRGHYEGRLEEREAAYHQGTAWPYLAGAFVRAALTAAPGDHDVREQLSALLTDMLVGGPVLGQVPQLADGDAPHRPRGCPAQAWSVAEILRALSMDLAE